ncbi:Hypothetical protein A7982_04522 [Minicystis rosea]|nr:Hypothetical protein A7982_04522 [Minicystis rosea]
MGIGSRPQRAGAAVRACDPPRLAPRHILQIASDQGLG